MVEIGDMTARLVLGDGNMDEWNHARFMSTLNIIYWSVSFTPLVIVQLDAYSFLAALTRVAMSPLMPMMSHRHRKEPLIRKVWFRLAASRSYTGMEGKFIDSVLVP